MIVLLHNTKKLTAIEPPDENLKGYLTFKNIGAAVYAIAKQFPDQIIVWCHENRRQEVNATYIKEAFPHDRYMYSFSTNGNYFPEGIGYIEDTPFIKINKAVLYPTWQMSSEIGAMKASTILLIPQEYWLKKQPFDFLLCSIAKLYQPLGLFCYSNPKLLKNNYNKIRIIPVASLYLLFKFVKQHYKWVWVLLLHLNYFIYEKKLTFFQLLNSLWIKKNRVKATVLDFTIPEVTIDKVQETIDVIIPTIGRKIPLYDVLKDLNQQTHLPKKVIIVEQNPKEASVSELDYLTTESWNFDIEHVFTHQTGACNARNIALKAIKSKWCFLADDDIRITTSFLEQTLENVLLNQIDIAVASCLLANESKKYFILSQTTIFGSGCSFCKSSTLKDIAFNLKLEFGFGEDTDFGLQLRNNGTDVFYIPDAEIIHLKASVGGFRTKFSHPWENDSVLPKPSPTIMYVKKKFNSQQQVLGYKLRLFLKTHKLKLWNFFVFKKQWKKSEYWLNKL